MKNLQLCLHSGAEKVTRDELSGLETPRATHSHVPIPHDCLLETVENHLRQTGLTVTGEAHAITRTDGGMRYFGLLSVSNRGVEHDDYSWVLGLRNSHDKTFPAALAAGSQVFVCDNLAFNGEVKLARKHTRFINRDLPQIVSRVVGMLAHRWNSLETRINAYKERELTDAECHDLVIRMLDARAINTTDVPAVLQQYRTPNHAEFAARRNVWRAFNAATEVQKGANVFMLPARTEALHGVMDAYCGIVEKV